jgi:hypothetical protein
LAAILVVLAYSLFFDRPQFEYRTRFVGDPEQESPESLEQMLDAMGADGWELVSFRTQHWNDDAHPTTARVSLRRRRR